MAGSKTLIYGDATNDQISAIDHIGSHARLLAGPGAGKTNYGYALPDVESCLTKEMFEEVKI